MGRRWYDWRRMLRTNRPMRKMMIGLLLILSIGGLWGARGHVAGILFGLYEEYGVWAAGKVMEVWLPAGKSEGREWNLGKTPVVAYLQEHMVREDVSEDPAYERLLAAEWEKEMQSQETSETSQGWIAGTGTDDSTQKPSADEVLVGELITRKPVSASVPREKLVDYDYLIQNFYSIHPTTTADRSMMDAGRFLSMDLSIEPSPEEPQILIYHTHSQEAFVDYPQNPEATIVGVGAYLAECLEQAGYQVIHDTSIYDMKDGELDRSQAYTYALEGIAGILQKYPSIEVVLDIHRDGVDENTHLVTEIDGKPTAKIMFFNGTSQTPDGPIEYLPNPNREANMAFSFQMQLLAAEQYPGLTRKIYLKGLRYNQHVRARTALVEVGAQTNTYAEALNAMEPLADLLCQVLGKD